MVREKFITWLCAWADLATDLVTLLTFAFVEIEWDVKVRRFFVQRMMKKKMKEDKEEVKWV